MCFSLTCKGLPSHYFKKDIRKVIDAFFSRVSPEDTDFTIFAFDNFIYSGLQLQDKFVEKMDKQFLLEKLFKCFETTDEEILKKLVLILNMLNTDTFGIICLGSDENLVALFNFTLKTMSQKSQQKLAS